MFIEDNINFFKHGNICYILTILYLNFVFRITGFLDAWPKLEKWYTKFGTLKAVDASQEQKSVYLEVDKILEDTINRVNKC